MFDWRLDQFFQHFLKFDDFISQNELLLFTLPIYLAGFIGNLLNFYSILGILVFLILKKELILSCCWYISGKIVSSILKTNKFLSF